MFRKVRAIRSTLKEPDVTVKVACEKKQPLFILGYSVLQGNSLLWVYVKGEFRKQGIATALAKGTESVFPPMTKIGKAIAAKKGLKEV